MLDTYRHKGLRKQLIEKLREKGIADQRILDAFDAVPRHFFFNGTFLEQAYTDMAFQIGAGQTISHPFTVAFQTQLLELKKGERVLEIGTGSGYQTAILCEIGAKVFSIERQRELYMKTSPFLKKLGYLPKLKFGDGYKGWPVFAPFDKIIITCGAPYIPEELTAQLKKGGRMVIPLGEGGNQKMILIEKLQDGTLRNSEHGDFKFVPMLKKTAR